MDKGVYRIIDANLNRVMEAIRVCEDIVRFASEDKKLTKMIKDLRHNVFIAIKDLRTEHIKEFVESRDIANDVGTVSNESETSRENILDLLLANTQRGKESLRVLEEVLKLFDKELSSQYKKFRFEFYEIEKVAVKNIEKLKD